MRKIAENRILSTWFGLQTEEAVVLKALAYAPAAIWAALLLFVGGRSDVPTVDTPLPLDKAAHFLLYGVLGVLVAFGWLRAGRRPPLTVPLLLALAVGVTDELNQRRVEGRSPELADVIADVAGIMAGCWTTLRLVKDSRNADQHIV